MNNLFKRPVSLLGATSSNSFATLLTGNTAPVNAFSGLLSSALCPTAPAPALPIWQWLYVRRRFGRLLSNITITDWQRQDGETKQAGIRNCLNRYYWLSASETDNSILIGSWGKGTRVRPARDIDILFLLPADVYWRFQDRTGNRQSQLLQEVKNVLLRTNSQTKMRGDGQVIVVPFKTIQIEIAPGFRCQDGSIIVCDTNGQGRYKTSTAEAEARDLSFLDSGTNGNTRTLVRIMKQWQREQNVPLKSFQLERLAVEFMRVWPHRNRDLFWYDWMVRDFFAYLLSRANSYLFMPGTGEAIAIGADWKSRAETAYKHAVSACIHEHNNYEALAGQEWQEIFGSAIPMVVS
jgi:hypothetical protein